MKKGQGQCQSTASQPLSNPRCWSTDEKLVFNSLSMSDAVLKMFSTLDIQLMEGSLECRPTLSPGAPALLHCPTHSTLCIRGCDWPSNCLKGLLINLLRDGLFAPISETTWSVILEMGCVDRQGGEKSGHVRSIAS